MVREGNTSVLVETDVNLVPAGSTLAGIINQSLFQIKELLPDSV
jgi:hypothetical protein